MAGSVYRLQLGDAAEPLVLRVAPPAERHFGSEAHLMRNEYASVPWLAPIAALMPKVLASDFTGTVLDRDWMIQSFLPGSPAPQRLGSFPKDTHGLFFRQLGEITAAVHAVVGPYFGPVVGPGHGCWSQAVVASLRQIANDMEGCGLDAVDLRQAADVAQDGAHLLDEVGEPRLLTGDLWTVNTLLAPAPVPAICGVLDMTEPGGVTRKRTGRCGWPGPSRTSGCPSSTATLRGPTLSPDVGGGVCTRCGTSAHCAWSGTG
ncbi:hypothetical protein GCM10010425_74500 [Streptomyces spororaveus]|uniref:Aminoglycoside phosphotransferase domain-containing protein n=1 Tax=Streptomyces spororaveus TaxID=284039 RepID=A0ABQ3T259_9ACTN|nr:aminoglycoside phosphotransferase family protein [Streptomyces spororaveus]GHI74476.1 hypothetical protein Sspor_00370 [Streptomyces spororaveus]